MMEETELTYGEMPAVIRAGWKEFPILLPWATEDRYDYGGSWMPQSVLTDPEWENPEEIGLVVVVHEN